MNIVAKTRIVGTKIPNEFGIYDVIENVWEWRSDWYGAYSGNGVFTRDSWCYVARLR